MTMQKYKSIIIIFFLCAAFSGWAEFRTWTLGDGSTMEAEFERREINTVFLRASEGTLYKVAFEQLILDDKMYLLDLKPDDYSRSNPAARLMVIRNIFGSGFIDVNGVEHGAEELDYKILGVYFSKKKSKACEEFTPKIKPFIEALGEQAKHVKIIYVGVDENKDDFTEAFKATESDWLAIPFESPMRKKIADRFKVILSPSLLFVSSAGSVIQEEGHLAIADETGAGATEFKKWLKISFADEDESSEAEEE